MKLQNRPGTMLTIIYSVAIVFFIISRMID